MQEPGPNLNKKSTLLLDPSTTFESYIRIYFVVKSVKCTEQSIFRFWWLDNHHVERLLLMDSSLRNLKELITDKWGNEAKNLSKDVKLWLKPLCWTLSRLLDKSSATSRVVTAIIKALQIYHLQLSKHLQLGKKTWIGYLKNTTFLWLSASLTFISFMWTLLTTKGRLTRQ